MRTTTRTPDGHGSIHLPSPSYWPLVSSDRAADHGLRRRSTRWWLIGLGAVVALVGFYGWALEPSVAED